VETASMYQLKDYPQNKLTPRSSYIRRVQLRLRRKERRKVVIKGNDDTNELNRSWTLEHSMSWFNYSKRPAGRYLLAVFRNSNL